MSDEATRRSPYPPDHGATQLIADLKGEVEAARTLLAGFGFRGAENYLLDRVLFGYLWSAVAAGEVVLAELKGGHPHGLYPTLRSLFEAAVDLAYIATLANRQVAACTAFLRDLEAHREFVEYARAVEELAGIPPEERKPETDADQPLEGIAEVVKELIAHMGCSAERADELMDEALRRLQTRGGSWHWSRLDFDSRIRKIRKHGKLDATAEQQLFTLKRIFASYAHASPAVTLLEFELAPDGTHGVEDTRSPNPETAGLMAGQAEGLLKMVRLEVEAMHADARSDDGDREPRRKGGPRGSGGGR